MTETPDDRLEGFKFAPEYTQKIAEITACWSCLEYQISMCIWHLAGVYPAVGACISSQIFTLDGRLKALKSLLTLRRAPEELCKRINKFSERVRGPLELRNRVIHDQWFSDDRTPALMQQMEIGAKGTLTYGFKPVPIAQLKDDHSKIVSAMIEASEIRDAVEDALPTLPEIPSRELHPIILHGPGHERTRSSDKTFLLFPPKPSLR
jgi:hypothetical protein